MTSTYSVIKMQHMLQHQYYALCKQQENTLILLCIVVEFKFLCEVLPLIS